MFKFETWDIVQAEVPYIDDPAQSSIRPVLIISPTEVLVLKMTTHHHSEKPKPFEYEMMKWGESGLTSRTFIQCNRFISLSDDNFTGKKYGRLTPTDIIGVRTMMRYHGLTK